VFLWKLYRPLVPPALQLSVEGLRSLSSPSLGSLAAVIWEPLQFCWESLTNKFWQVVHHRHRYHRYPESFGKHPSLLQLSLQLQLSH
jgi:hypothetical protein